MSYNVSKWETRHLRHLRLSIGLLYAGVNTSFRPAPWKFIPDSGGCIRIVWHDRCFIDGQFLVKDRVVGSSVIEVSKICMEGDASGIVYNEALLPALHASAGELEVVLIWEGGDYVHRLKVKDGDVIEKAIAIQNS